MKNTIELPRRGPRKKLVGTLEKGLAVLDALAERSGAQGRTLTEISELVGMNMSTTSRILSALTEWGYVRRVQDRYGLGVRTLALGKVVLETLDVRGEARPVLEKLSREVEQTCHLGLLDQGEVVYIDKVEPSRPFQMRSRIGDRMPAHSTALGKAALAFSPANVVAPILSSPLRAQTPKTVVNPEDLLRQLNEIRRTGYSIDTEENEEGVICIGAPIFDHRGELAAAISMSGPTFVMGSDQLPALGRRLSQAALAISRRLGYPLYGEAAQHWSLDSQPWWSVIPDMVAAEMNSLPESAP